MRLRPLFLQITLIVWMGVIWCVPACKAQLLYEVSLDTSPLVTASSGPFSLDFQLLDGSGSGDANNTAVLNQLNFGIGGSAAGDPTVLGGATGDVSSAVTLTDSSFLNEFVQPFTPGDTLRFNLSVTNNQDIGDLTDQFAFALLDGNGTALPTFGPGNALLTVDLATGGLQTFSTSGPSSVSLNAPAVTVVPEPSAIAFLLTGCTGWMVMRKLRRS